MSARASFCPVPAVGEQLGLVGSIAPSCGTSWRLNPCRGTRGRGAAEDRSSAVLQAAAGILTGILVAAAPAAPGGAGWLLRAEHGLREGGALSTRGSKNRGVVGAAVGPHVPPSPHLRFGARGLPIM